MAHLQLNANGGGAGGGLEAGPGGGGGEGGGGEPHAAAGLAGAGGGGGGAGLAGLLHHPDVAFAHQLELTEQVRPREGVHKLGLVGQQQPRLHVLLKAQPCQCDATCGRACAAGTEFRPAYVHSLEATTVPRCHAA